jgi:ABC-type nitrate/sulfonate/bicarbonate transport system permease component
MVAHAPESEPTALGRPDLETRPGRRPVRFTQRPGARALLGCAGVLCVLAAMQLTSATNLIPTTEIPSVTSMFGALWGALGQSSLWTGIGQTLGQAITGLLITMVAAIPLGLLIGSSDLLWRSVRTIVEFMRPVPAAAILPIIVLLYGTQQVSAVVVVVFGTFFQMLIQSIYGRREVEAVALDTARSFQLGPFTRFFRLILPSAAPFLATGVRLCGGGSLLLAMLCGIILNTPGLGNLVVKAQTAGTYDLMYALIIVSGLLGLALMAVLGLLERRILRWHPSQRGEV